MPARSTSPSISDLNAHTSDLETNHPQNAGGTAPEDQNFITMSAEDPMTQQPSTTIPNVEHPAPSVGVYTVDDVALILGLARCIAYARVRDGSIPARRVGRRWIISKATFHAWLDGTEQKGNVA
jgi:excisionase family DNA binding protein